MAQSAGIFSLEAQNFVSEYPDIITGFDKDGTFLGADTDNLQGLYAQCITDIDQLQGTGPAHVHSDNSAILDPFCASETSLSEEGSEHKGETAVCSCPILAFTTLQDMFHAEPQCRGDTVIPGLARGDRIIKTNRTTMQRLEQLLSCDKETCARDSTVLFMMMASFSKVLAWYHFAFVAIISEPPPYRSTDESSDPAFHDRIEPAFATPILIGDFSLDFFSEQRMKAQFLLCEVQKLIRVFDLAKARSLYHTQEDQQLGIGSKGKQLLAPAIQQFFSTALDDLTTLINDYCTAKPPAREQLFPSSTFP